MPCHFSSEDETRIQKQRPADEQTVTFTTFLGELNQQRLARNGYLRTTKRKYKSIKHFHLRCAFCSEFCCRLQNRGGPAYGADPAHGRRLRGREGEGYPWDENQVLDGVMLD